MSQVNRKPDDIKRKLRELKKLEIRVRFPGHGLHNINMTPNNINTNKRYNNIGSTSKEAKGNDLVWNQFFDLKDEGSKKVKYSMNRLSSMTKEEFKEVVSEYFYHVYYWYSKENGITDPSNIDTEILTYLGLSINTDYDEIKRKFRELAKIYHPDNGGDSAKFMEIMEKYKDIRK